MKYIGLYKNIFRDFKPRLWNPWTFTPRKFVFGRVVPGSCRLQVEEAVQRCSVKNVFLKILQIKCFQWILRNFQEHLFLQNISGGGFRTSHNALPTCSQLSSYSFSSFKNTHFRNTELGLCFHLKWLMSVRFD